eukprot:208687_1
MIVASTYPMHQYYIILVGQNFIHVITCIITIITITKMMAKYMKIGGNPQNVFMLHRQYVRVAAHLWIILGQETLLQHDEQYFQHEYHQVMRLFVLIPWYIICIF